MFHECSTMESLIPLQEKQHSEPHPTGSRVLFSCSHGLTVICKGGSAKSISGDGQQSAVSDLTGIRGSQTIQNKLEGKASQQAAQGN